MEKKKESIYQRSKRILKLLAEKYPGATAYDIDGRGEHFVCEVETAKSHSGPDRAIEVILSSQPHKHLKTTQHYAILSGILKLHVGGEIVVLHPGDIYIVKPNNVHWGESNDECWVEIRSNPGWTKEDHIVI